VVEGIGRHASDDRQVIDHLGEMRQEFGEFGAAPAVPGELEFRPQQFALGIDERRPVTLQQFWRRQGAVKFRERRLVVEHLQVTRRPGHEEVDHPFGPRVRRRTLRCQGIEGDGGVAGFLQELTQGDGPEPETALMEKPPARNGPRILAPIEVRLAIHRSLILW
jgi:hypothetical protein